MPIGSIIAYAGKETPENYLFCDGQTFNQSEYPDLYKVLGTNTTPKLNDNRFLEGADSYGTAKDAGLPNIKGTYGANGMTDGEMSSSGALYQASMTKMTSQSWSKSNQSTQIGLDASKYSSVYKDSISTVQPKSLTVRYIIRAK